MSQKEDTKILFGTKGGFAIAKLIFNYPHKKYHIRELAKETGYSTTAIVGGIELLEKYKIIKTELGAVTKDIQADLESDAYKHYKLIFNLYRLTRHNIVDSLVNYFNNPGCIVLFGSFAKERQNGNSDIDLALVFGYVNDIIDLQISLMKIRTNKDLMIEPHPFAQKDFKETEPIVAEILRTGIPLV